jgi:hypothetical protein
LAEAKGFECPNCGSPLVPEGTRAEVRCAFCGSSVIVPEELRGLNPQGKDGASVEELLSAKADLEQTLADGMEDPELVELVNLELEEIRQQLARKGYKGNTQ